MFVPPTQSPIANRFNIRRNAGSIALLTITGLIVVKNWILPLRTSLWLDETGTFWSIQKGFLETFSRCLARPGQSPFYGALLWIFTRIFGESEIALRVPSLFAMILCTLLLYRLADTLLGRQAAFFSSLLFVSLEPVAFAAADARPYSLALLCAVASTWLLVRYLDHRSIGTGLAYIVAAASVLYLHYLFGTVLIVHVIYVLYRSYEQGYPKWKRDAVAAGILLSLLLVPLLPDLHALVRIRAIYVFAATPTPIDLYDVLAPRLLVVGLLAGLVIAKCIYPHSAARNRQTKGSTALLLFAWALVPVLLLFTVSLFTANKVFVQRYLLPSAPALALLAGWAISHIEPVGAQRTVTAAALLISLISLGGIRHLPSHGRQNWRDALSNVRAMIADTSTPVLVRSGFCESNYLDWPSDVARAGYLFAPLQYYKAPDRIIPLPFWADEPALKYLDQVITQTLDHTKEFVYIATAYEEHYSDWLQGRVAPAGFKAEKIGNYENLNVWLFRR